MIKKGESESPPLARKGVSRAGEGSPAPLHEARDPENPAKEDLS